MVLGEKHFCLCEETLDCFTRTFVDASFLLTVVLPVT